MIYTDIYTSVSSRCSHVIPHLMRNLLLVTAAVTTLSCTGHYLEKNTNPYEVSRGQMETDGYNVGAAITAMCGAVISTDVNTAQFTDCLLGGPMGGYYSSKGDFPNTVDNFDAPDGWTNVFMASDRVIPTLYSNLAELRKITDDPVILAMAQVIKVAAMHRVTDTYGPIQYSMIGQDGKLTIPYDTQEGIYGKFFEELDEALAVLTENSGRDISANADPVYSGSVRNWCRFANSLKLRLAMRISYADATLSRQMAEAAVSHPMGLIEDNSQNASLKPVAFGDKGNSLYVAIKYNQPIGCETGGDSHAAAEITSYMNAYNDPRREMYFIPSEFPDDKWCGQGISIKKQSLANGGRKFSGIRITPSDPLMWMNAAEVAFLKAEGALFGFDMGGRVEDLYYEGIRLSFAQWGVSSAFESYIEPKYDSENGEIEDDVAVSYSNMSGDGYKSETRARTVAWNDYEDSSLPAEDLKERMQERIITQKWIANFNLGNEAWADRRRTGYPHFFEVKENRSNGQVKNEDGARRMKYPEAEKTNNSENYQEAVASKLKGPDSMGTRLWWDCKPSKSKQ